MPRPTSALIVDDEAHARSYVRLLLGEAGIKQYWEASDGAEALALFARHQPDLVLLDVNLRMMTGLQVLQQIKQTRPEVMVVMLSSENAMKTVNEALRLGADAYILKHSPTREALDALVAALDDAEDRDTGDAAEGEKDGPAGR